MFDEAFDSIRTYLSERFSSPLLGAFAVAWSLVNYRIFFILFSDERVMHKFALVEAIVFPDQSTFLIKGVFVPLAIALAYIFVYPWPARLVYQYLRWQQRLTLAVQQKMDDETPLTKEDVREFNRINRERNRNNEIEIEERDKRIETLRRENQELEARLSKLEGAKGPMVRLRIPGLGDISEKENPSGITGNVQAEPSNALMDGTIHKLAENDPRAAIAAAWHEVLAALERAAKEAGISFPPEQPYLVAGVLRKRTFLSTDDVSELSSLQKRVELMESKPEHQPTTDEALNFVNLSQGIAFQLAQAIRAWNGTSQ